ncbi:YkgJ family cysteine cluster protein [bacterium]|nr:YkgJ family cysteine cluster protein [bacterium]
MENELPEISEELKNYIQYLIYLNDKLSKFFDHQKDYIACKKGCAKCCKNAEFPYKKIEFDLLMEGFKTLPEDKQQLIKERVKNLKEEQKKTEGRLSHTCPFLIDDVCSVYDFRGIICRSFGLMFYNENDTPGIPFCIFEGLNYSALLNKETGRVSSEKYKELGYTQEPLAFNVSHSFLTDEVIAKGFGFTFGETKPMLDWFEEDFYNV